MNDQNLSAYSSPHAIEVYSRSNTLTACESYLFDRYIGLGQAVLDLGVGGGRTTAHLAASASSYVGLDYSQAMVDVCREKFPTLQFVCDDASDLQRFASNSFDVVVFSFNGIDTIRTDSARTRCFTEAARVLSASGYFIFSSHNARSIGFRANLRKYLVDRVVKSEHVVTSITTVSKARSLAAEVGLRRLLRKFWRSLRISIEIFWRKLLVPEPLRGTGYFFEYSHGGLILFASTPKYVSAEAKSAGFEVVEVVGNNYPANCPNYAIQSYYYVLRVSPK